MDLIPSFSSTMNEMAQTTPCISRSLEAAVMEAGHELQFTADRFPVGLAVSAIIHVQTNVYLMHGLLADRASIQLDGINMENEVHTVNRRFGNGRKLLAPRMSRLRSEQIQRTLGMYVKFATQIP